MGMYAEVLAIGPFRAALVPYLRHPPERYRDTRDGAAIVEVVFSIQGSARSRDLAACFGADAWDFNSHALDPARIDFATLRELYAHEWACGDHVRDGQRAECASCRRRDPVERYCAFRDAGHEFHFRPNG